MQPAAAPPDEHAQAARSSWDLPEGTEIAPGRTTLSGLGGGSRYEVYLVWDEQLFSLAVAKVLRPEAVDDARARRGLVREAELLQRLAHPAIVRGLGGHVHGSYPHVLMEHVDGPTLRKLVKRFGPIAIEQAVSMVLGIASALQYLSNQRVVHLDIKPANLIIGIQPRLIDLSIARPIAEAVRIDDAVGTRGYMAPEQCAPVPGGIGTPADVWSLGATLFFALTGKTPHRDRAPAATAPPPDLPDHVPPTLAALTRRMLAPEPTVRPTPREIVMALEPLVVR